ncbi:MAG: VOC family protein [Candidatus Bathyarchaeota archaeon]|nr:VOC family protein [Candidatus Bathyarchaeota archaeon]MDH5495558.1 VOC family protein [Candidatus Bathyarchaeota archaeon]
METFLKIDSIMFYVSDLEKSAKFYESVLGLKVGWTDKEERMIGFLFPESDSEIVIHNDPDLPNPSFSFMVRNVEKFCDKYEKRGYRIVKEPFEVRCGKFAVLADPDGNELPIIDLTKFGDKPRYDE